MLASLSHRLYIHVAQLYQVHSTEGYCGKCITLLTSGHTILASLQRVVVLAFALGTVASIITVYDQFLSQKDALKLWTPLTLCYTLLVFHIQGDCQANCFSIDFDLIINYYVLIDEIQVSEKLDLKK